MRKCSKFGKKKKKNVTKPVATTILLFSSAKKASPPEAEVPVPGSDVSVGRHRAVVERIRREEFGIGLVLNDDAKRLLCIQEERLGRSLDRLVDVSVIV